jgi:hypothetical protein
MNPGLWLQNGNFKLYIFPLFPSQGKWSVFANLLTLSLPQGFGQKIDFLNKKS